MKRLTLRVPPTFLTTLMTTPGVKMATETRHDPYDALAEVNLTLHLRISSQLVVSALPDSIRSTVTQSANGDLSRVQVVEITPSQVVLMVTNSHDTTVPTRTRSITSPGTSTESAITAITDGMQRMTPTTTPTSRSNTKRITKPKPKYPSRKKSAYA